MGLEVVEVHVVALEGLVGVASFDNGKTIDALDDIGVEGRVLSSVHFARLTLAVPRGLSRVNHKSPILMWGILTCLASMMAMWT